MSARILVVDDQPANVRMLEAKLLAEYFDVSTAENGVAAIDIARQEQPDLILLDIMMPGIDGYETCQRLKADLQTRHIPVIMVTALDQREDRIRGLECGADDFLTKPIADVTLFARVRSLLRLQSTVQRKHLHTCTYPHTHTTGLRQTQNGRRKKRKNSKNTCPNGATNDPKTIQNQ